MANTSSAKKATRKIARRTIINKSRRTQMRGAVRTVEEAIQRGDRDAALKAMAHAEPELIARFYSSPALTGPHWPDRHSMRLLARSVARASRVSSEATAKAAENWYSL